jgi:hypothetical protein
VTASAHRLPVEERARVRPGSTRPWQNGALRGSGTMVPVAGAGPAEMIEEITLEDGSIVVSAAHLARFGGGDVAVGRTRLRDLIRAEYQPKVFDGPTEKPANVRAATSKDEPAILRLLLQDAEENAAHVAPVDEARIAKQIQACSPKYQGVIGLIDGPDGEPVACTLLVRFQWWWSQAWAYQEVVTYVHPDHRRARHVHDLLQFQRWWVDAMTRGFGYRVYLMCGVLGVHRVAAKIALYRRKFRQAGSVFVYPSPFSGDGS